MEGTRRGQTFVEKVLARAAGRAAVTAGEIVEVTPDRVLSHDNTAAIVRLFREMGGTRVWDPERLVITLDHASPAPTVKHAENHAVVRQFVREQGIRHFFDVGEGICHQLIAEHALVLPGQVLLGADSHTPHQGWMGAFAAGIGRSETAAVWALGRLWLRVPETMRVVLHGHLRDGVTAKDLALTLIGALGADAALYQAVEFAGDGVASLSVEDRMVLANMMAEMGAKCAYIPPDEKTLAWLAPRLARRLGISERAAWSRLEAQVVFPDPQAHYARVVEVDLARVRPVVAQPHRVDNVAALATAAGTPIQQAFIGTCTHGRLSDLEAAARVLAGKRVAPGVRLLVIPASREVYLQALEKGIIQTFLEAGAIVGPPGCGPCMGNHMGVLGPGEVAIMAANRNFRGRMGDRESAIYLASPEVVAQAAVEGRIPEGYPEGYWVSGIGESERSVGHDLWRAAIVSDTQSPAPQPLISNTQSLISNTSYRITGRAWKYGDHINTDLIFPGRYTYTVHEPEEMAKHALEDLDPEFAANVRPGDVIVAGRNWGNGSSREQAVTALKAAGVAAIIVKSCARIYYRNAFNNGLPVIIAGEAVDAIEAGDEVTVDLARGEIITPRGTFRFPPPPPNLMRLLDAGGLIPYVREVLQCTA